MVKAESRDDCWGAIVAVVTAVLDEQGEEPGPLTRATLLNADLGISSVDALHMVIMLEDRLGIPLNFEQVAVRDGEYVEDLALGELLDFLVASFDTAHRRR
jgi:acyl carrier protein